MKLIETDSIPGGTFVKLTVCEAATVGRAPGPVALDNVFTIVDPSPRFEPTLWDVRGSTAEVTSEAILKVEVTRSPSLLVTDGWLGDWRADVMMDDSAPVASGRPVDTAALNPMLMVADN